MARFPRRARLLKPAEFKRVFESGKRVTTPHFTAVIAPGAEAEPRLGLALSRKQLPRAVDRNRVKRQVRASFRESRAALPLADIVLMTRNQAAGLPRGAANQELAKLWSLVTARWSVSSSSSSAPTSA